jgi:Tol biopolymer transport system component
MTAREDLRMPRDDMDRLLAAWFEDDARGSAPPSMVDAAIARSAATPRRSSRLLLTKRWPSMIATLRLRFVPLPRPALLLVVLAILLAIVAAAVYVGNHRPLNPFGPARNGYLSLDSDGDIYVTNADGTGRRALTSGPALDQWPSFSPDGSLVAFGSRPPSGADELIVVSVADGHQTVIDSAVATSPSNPGPPAMVSWSPDSRHLAFVRDVRLENGVGSFGRLFLADLATGKQTPLGVQSDDTSDPAWSPDGSTIAFRRLNADHTLGTLMFIDPDGRNERPAPVEAGDTAAFGAPQWSPDSTHLVVYGGAWPHQIEIVSRDAGVPAVAIAPGLGDEFFPSWSNDGTRIAWEVGQGNSPKDVVYLADADGSNVRQLDVPDVTGSTLYWSPDDAYLFGLTSDSASVVVIPTDGTPVHLIPAPHTGSSGNWQRLAPCLVQFFC